MSPPILACAPLGFAPPLRAVVLCLVLLLPGLSQAQPGGRAFSVLLERLGIATSRNLDELQVLSRAVSHVSPGDAKEMERLLAKASKGDDLTEEELRFFERVASGVDEPLQAASDSFRAGARAPLMGTRTLQNGSRMVVGSEAHKAQCWLEYQFRHSRKYRRIS